MDENRVTLSGNKPEVGTEGTGAPGHLKENGQHSDYWVLSDEERAKGFVRPVRTTYVHVGIRPEHPLRDLTEEEKEEFKAYDYVKYEEYPEEHDMVGQYWTEKKLNSGCGVATTMSQKIAETYAREPTFYGATFCCGSKCQDHFPVGEFKWDDGQVVGS